MTGFGPGLSAVDVADIDHDWLHTRLGWRVNHEQPVSAESLLRAGGSTCGVHRVRCGDRSFIYKTAPQGNSVWAQWIRDADAVAREVRSYRLLGEHGPVAELIAPRCYWSTLGVDGRGALALQDLGASGAPDPTALARGLTYPQARAAMRPLAVLHALAANTAADFSVPPHPWLLSASSADLITAIRAGFDDLPRAWEICQPDVGSVAVQRIISGIDVEQELIGAHQGSTLISVCHGDLWAGNLVFTTAGPARPMTARLIDWQFTMWGNPLSDLAVLLMSSLHPAHRQAWQEPLLRHYHQTLIAQSGLAYSFAECLDDFDRAQRFAALVVLATLDGYTAEMTVTERARFAPRVLTALNLVTTAYATGTPSDTDSFEANSRTGAR
ncbi:ecdysteroid 22-kinase family protein [Nocardia vinacea]|uniref:oxidoreductase family protein n=1 Tax=Nocardia vinacea TaxID=96468 RepID=UPI002E1653C9|nr:ecdysteroid 22-kinase family protein [Nocardia vinacea]